jgi:muconolactone delta-isomerase
MQFLSISQPQESFTDAQYALLVEAEVRRARELYAEGAIRQLWHRADTPGVCILWEAGSADEVLEMLKTLPFTRAGIVESSLIPLKPYIGFGPG